jgi:hypothetical protein
MMFKNPQNSQSVLQYCTAKREKVSRGTTPTFDLQLKLGMKSRYRRVVTNMIDGGW